MTFKPPSAALSTEEILDSEPIGFEFSNQLAMGIQNSAIRQLPQLDIDYATGIQWPAIAWSSTEDFFPQPGLIDTGWDYGFNTFSTGSPVDWEFDDKRLYLKFETNTSEYIYIERTSTGADAIFTGFSNETGYTFQIRLMIENSDTGSPYPSHQLHIEDDVASTDMYFVETGIGFISDADTGYFISTNMTMLRSFRVGVKQNDIYVMLDDGYGIVGTDIFTGATDGVSRLWFGNKETGTESGVIATTYLDYIYEYDSGLIVDSGAAIVPVYSTGTETVTTPGYSPNRNVQQFSAAYFDQSIGNAGGTTEVKAQYQSSVATSWTDYLDFVTLNYPQHEMLLDNIPTAGDGSDALRFIVRQSSTDGSAEAARVERITVQSRFNEAKLRGFPRWGSTAGGNTIALELYSTRGLIAPAVSDANTIALFGFDSTGADDSTLTDNTGNLLGSYTTGIASPIGNQLQLSDVLLDTGSNLETLFDGTYNVTGISAAGGEIASGFVPVKLSGPSAGLYFETVTSFTGSTALVMAGASVSAQKVWSNITGDGIEITDYTATSDGRKVIAFKLEMTRGALEIRNFSDNGDDYSHYVSAHDYHASQDFRFITHSFVDSEQNSLQILNSANAPGAGFAEFTIYDFHSYALDTGYVSITGASTYEFESGGLHPNSGWSVDMYVTPYAYNLADTGSMLMELTGADHRLDLSMDNLGYPIATIQSAGGTVTLTGNWPLQLDDRKNICLTYYNRTGALEGYAAVLVDGEINALTRTIIPGDAIALTGGTLTLGSTADEQKPYYGLVDQFRLRDAPAKPESHSQSLGLTDIFFRDVLEVPGYNATSGFDDNFRTVSLLHFNEPEGALVDDCEFWGVPASEVIVPHGKRRYTHRGEKGVIGGGVYFTRGRIGGGGLLIPENTGLNPKISEHQHSLFFYFGGYADPNRYSSLVKYVSDDDYGYEVGINVSGFMQVDIFTGLSAVPITHTHTGAPIATNQYVACGVAFDPTSLGKAVYTWVDTTNEETISIAYPDYLQGATYSGMEVGYGAMGAMDQFTVFHGVMDSGTFDVLRVPAKVKGIPENDIYVGGTKLHSDRVLPVSPRKTYVIMPENDPGETHVYADFNGVTISMERPYKYVQQYEKFIDFDKIEDAVCRTKSPFRIGNIVPDEAIGLASIRGPELLVNTNMSAVDLSDRELSNISNHLRGQFNLLDSVTGESTVTYSGQIDTQEIVLSNRSVLSRQATNPAPLYYKYLAGRGRYYLKQIGASSVDDINTIKESIRIIDNNGNTISSDVYPWDIEVSRSGINGEVLPPNVFSVILFTHKLSLFERTVFVQYPAVDAINRFKFVSDYREIVNPVPIFYGDGSARRDTFTLEFRNDGTYDLEIVTG